MRGGSAETSGGAGPGDAIGIDGAPAPRSGRRLARARGAGSGDPARPLSYTAPTGGCAARGAPTWGFGRTPPGCFLPRRVDRNAVRSNATCRQGPGMDASLISVFPPLCAGPTWGRRPLARGLRCDPLVGFLIWMLGLSTILTGVRRRDGTRPPATALCPGAAVVTASARAGGGRRACRRLRLVERARREHAQACDRAPAGHGVRGDVDGATALEQFPGDPRNLHLSGREFERIVPGVEVVERDHLPRVLDGIAGRGTPVPRRGGTGFQAVRHPAMGSRRRTIDPDADVAGTRAHGGSCCVSPGRTPGSDDGAGEDVGAGRRPAAVLLPGLRRDQPVDQVRSSSPYLLSL